MAAGSHGSLSPGHGIGRPGNGVVSLPLNKLTQNKQCHFLPGAFWQHHTMVRKRCSTSCEREAPSGPGYQGLCTLNMI